MYEYTMYEKAFLRVVKKVMKQNRVRFRLLQCVRFEMLRYRYEEDITSSLREELDFLERMSRVAESKWFYTRADTYSLINALNFGVLKEMRKRIRKEMTRLLIIDASTMGYLGVKDGGYPTTIAVIRSIVDKEIEIIRNEISHDVLAEKDFVIEVLQDVKSQVLENIKKIHGGYIE